MQCVILAAGKGTRLLPLTQNCPKPLVRIHGKPIIDYIVSALPPEVDELVMVVGYRGDMIREYCGEVFLGREVTYCEQTDPVAGTGDALLCAKNVLRNRFLLMYGDDILGAKGIADLIQQQRAVSGYYLEELGRFGPIIQNLDGTMKEIVLGIDNRPGEPGLAYVGGAVLDTSIFDAVSGDNRNQETLMIDMLNAYAAENTVQVVVHERWIPIGFPADIKKAEALLNE